MELPIWIGLFTPLLGFLILLLSSKIIGRKQTGIIGSSTIFIFPSYAF